VLPFTWAGHPQAGYSYPFGVHGSTTRSPSVGTPSPVDCSDLHRKLFRRQVTQYTHQVGTH